VSSALSASWLAAWPAPAGLPSITPSPGARLPLLMKQLEALHREVDRRAGALAEKHAARLACRKGCSGCCVDDLTCFEVEAENIRRHHAELLEHGVPHAPGRCAFLDEHGACRIYAQRPYVCRTQGLPLRWEDEDDGGEPVEYRDICPLNDEGDADPIEALPPEDCWTIGPVEAALQRLQHALDGGALKRVRLRDLFRRSAGSPP
jgi:uncharacterized protein